MPDPSKRFVYLLESLSERRRHYVGLTSDAHRRLAQHNSSRSPHTSKSRPWTLVVTIEFADEGHAARFERYLKSGSGRAFVRRHFAT